MAVNAHLNRKFISNSSLNLNFKFYDICELIHTKLIVYNYYNKDVRRQRFGLQTVEETTILHICFIVN